MLTTSSLGAVAAAPGRGTFTPSLAAAPSPLVGASPGGGRPDASIRPAGDSANVLQTISTLNGSSLPGNHAYFGGSYLQNITAVGDRLFVAGTYSGVLAIVNASSGAFVAESQAAVEPWASAYDSRNGELYVADLAGSVDILNPVSGALLGKIAIPGYPDAIAFDPVHDRVIVATGLESVETSKTDTVYFIDPTDDTIVAQRAVGEYPVSLAVDPSAGDVFVVNEYSGNVSVLSTSTYSLLSTLVDPDSPDAAVFDPADGDVYVAESEGDSVTVFDGSTYATVTTVSLSGNYALAETFDPQTNEVAALTSPGGLIEISGATNTVVGSIPVAVSEFLSNGVAYSAATHRYFVANANLNNVTGFNATTGTVETQTLFGLNPYAAVIDPVNHLLYVVNGLANNVSVINPTTGVVLGSIDAGPVPVNIAYDNASGLLYVPDEGGAVTVIDPTFGTVAGNISVGGEPDWVVYDPVDQRLFVSNFESGNVSVINGTSDRVVATVALGTVYPIAETLDPATGEVFVSDLTYSTAVDNLTPINPTTFAPGPSIPFGGDPWAGAFDPANGELAMSNETATGWYLTFVDPTTGAVVDSLPGLVDTEGPFVWDASAGALAVPDLVTNTVSFLAGASAYPITSVSVGEGPFATAVDPSTGLVYVVNEWASSISVISLSIRPNTVDVAVSPTDCGPAVLSGAPASGPVVLASGTYGVRAPNCYNYAFQGWTTSGGVSVGSSSAGSTNVSVTGNGSLTATYTLVPGSTFGVVVEVAPALCGHVVTLGGASYDNASSIPVAPGEYPVTAGLCVDHMFSEWQTTGSLSLVVQGPLGALLTVVGNGTLVALFVPTPLGGTTPVSTTPATTGYTGSEVAAFVVAGVLGGALGGLLFGRGRGRPPPPAAPAPPPPAPPPPN
jgi:YVTN family beta-propeller protein